MAMDRVQILLTPEQRRRLADVARQRHEPVTALVREAIDLAFPAAVGPAERRAAARRLLDRTVVFVPPDQLDDVLAGRFDVPD